MTYEVEERIDRLESVLSQFIVQTNTSLNRLSRIDGIQSAVDRSFAENRAKGKTATASHFRGNDSQFNPQKAIDGNKNSYWTTDDDVLTARLEIDLAEPTEFNRGLIQEHIKLGQRIESFSIEAGEGENWQIINEGTTVGYKRILRFPLVVASKIRLNVLKSRACPTVSNFAVFNVLDF